MLTKSLERERKKMKKSFVDLLITAMEIKTECDIFLDKYKKYIPEEMQGEFNDDLQYLIDRVTDVVMKKRGENK
jgi:hypothetical protein